MYVYIHTCTHTQGAHVYIYTYIYKYIHIYIYIYTYINIYSIFHFNLGVGFIRNRKILFDFFCCKQHEWWTGFFTLKTWVCTLVVMSYIDITLHSFVRMYSILQMPELREFR